MLAGQGAKVLLNRRKILGTVNIALHWDDKGDEGDGILCRGHSFTMWHSRRPDRANHGSRLGTGMCKRRLGDAGCGVVLKSLKPCKPRAQDGKKRKAQPAMGKADCQGKP